MTKVRPLFDRSVARSTSSRRWGVQILIQGGHNPYIPFAWYLI